MSLHESGEKIVRAGVVKLIAATFKIHSQRLNNLFMTH